MGTGIFGLWKVSYMNAKNYNTWRGRSKVGRWGKRRGDCKAQTYKMSFFKHLRKSQLWEGGKKTRVRKKSIRSSAQSSCPYSKKSGLYIFMHVRKGHSPLRARAANLNLQSWNCPNYIFTLDWCTRPVDKWLHGCKVYLWIDSTHWWTLLLFTAENLTLILSSNQFINNETNDLFINQELSKSI